MHQPGSRAKKARTTKSQQPACTHKEHQILTSAEATAFAAQFLDQASHREFLATCIAVDLEKTVKHAQWHRYTRKRGHKTTYFVRNNECSKLCGAFLVYVVTFAALYSKM